MIEILYEDNHILVCYKPKGILSQADGSQKEDMLTLLKAYLKEKYHKPGNVYLGLVHRLDINTSGVMVFAKTSKAAARLSESIKNHQMEKRYYATIEGTLTNSSYIEVRNFIEKDEKQRKAMISTSGLESILFYKSIKNYEINSIKVTDVDIILKTGRFHQIRAQFANMGHPLYGDIKYGSKYKIADEDFPLQAYALSFPHPITKEILSFEKINKNS